MVMKNREQVTAKTVKTIYRMLDLSNQSKREKFKSWSEQKTQDNFGSDKKIILDSATQGRKDENNV